MATIRIRYFTTRTRLDGTKRHYWQPSTDLVAAGWKVQPLSDIEAQAHIEAQRWNADLDRWRQNLGGLPIATKDGTVEWLIEGYKKSRWWKEISAKSKVSYEYAFRIIREWAGDSPVTAITPKLVQKFYEKHKDKTPAKASLVVRIMRILMQYAIREDLISVNPAARPGIKNTAKKGTLWSPEAVAYFVRQADEMGHFSHGTAVLVNEWIGQRMGDIVSLTKYDYSSAGEIHISQRKTGAFVVLPVSIVPKLKARLEAQMERNKKAVVSSTFMFFDYRGRPYTEDWFAEIFAKIRAKCAEKIAAELGELKEGHPLYGFGKLIFKDLRHTAVTRLAEAGCKTPTIASITGHSFRTCEAIVDRYNIRTSKMARKGFDLRLAAEQPKKEGTKND